MNKIDYVQFEPKALMADLAPFNATERGAYCSLFTWLYLNKGRCKKDLTTIKKICGNPHYFDKIWSNIKHKFPEKKGYIYHKRVSLELRAAKKRMQKAHNAGLTGAEARWRKQRDGNADAMPSHSGRIANINGNINTITYTLQEVKDAAVLIGLSDQQAEKWYHHFAAQGFVFANNLPIRNLSEALVRWRNNQYKFERPKNGSRPESNQVRKRAFAEQESEIGTTIE